jgi:hypothetical protein
VLPVLPVSLVGSRCLGSAWFWEVTVLGLGSRGSPLAGRLGSDGSLRGASTDMANVSLVIPTIHPAIGLDCAGAVNHQPEFAAWCAEPTGDQAVLDGALAMAWTVIDNATSDQERRRLLGTT